MNTQIKKRRKVYCLVLAVILFTTALLPLPGNVAQASNPPPVKILEIQPSTSFDITSTIKASLKSELSREIEVTTMPMPLFISKAEEVNGCYDIVYIGNNTATTDKYNSNYKGNVYGRFGPQVANNWFYAKTVEGNKEFYAGNDISDIAASKLKSFIEAGQLIIFDSGIFSSGMKDTKLYKNFINYKNNSSAYTNVKCDNTQSLLEKLKEYKNTGMKKRPTLVLTQKPVEYNGNNIAENAGLISFAMNLRNNNSAAKMSINLYIDQNGDGVYKSDEITSTYKDIGSMDNYSVNCHLPSKFTGLVPWKIEVVDDSGAKAYETGFTAVKGDEQKIRVLQLLPNNNDNSATLKLSTLSNFNSQNLLYKQGEYNIIVTEMKIGDFNTNYGNQVNGNPTTLNGNYDMVIFGFEDSYIGDLSGKALDDMIAFADSDQAIMFTHDTIGFTSSETNLTKHFRDRLGMNAFATDASKPSGVTASTGLTRLANFYQNGAPRFPDTIKTSKINESNLTKYPYILGDITVSPTHLQYLRLDPEDPDIVTAFTYRNEYIYKHGTRTATLVTPVSNEDMYHEYDGLNDYYTYFKGNLTFSGTGHSSIKSLEEVKMFVNTMLKASVGANHAPSVEILGLNDGQDIANTLEKLNFSLLAKDPDMDDKKLNCKVYIDNDGDGKYETSESVLTLEGANALENELVKAVEMAKNVNNKVTQFKIKAVVTDQHGAQGSKEITINNKDVPVLNLGHNTVNRLVGDRADLNLTVTAQATKFSTTYSNLVLQMKLNTSAFKDIAAVGGGSVDGTGNYSRTLNSVIFNPAANIASQNGQLQFVCKKEGVFSATSKLTYKDAINTTRTVEDPITINVKTGTVNVELKDNFGAAIGGHAVKLQKYSGDSDVFDTGFAALTAVTDETGIARFTSVPTGYYGATIELPKGYMPVDNSNIGNSVTKKGGSQLNYDNNSIVIAFPALYRVPVITIHGKEMFIWTKQQLTAETEPDLYSDWQVKWQVAPDTASEKPGDGIIDPDTGILTAKRVGNVVVTCTSINTDPGGNKASAQYTVIIIKNDIDIN